jgi:leucyl-tRNA synthetase
MAKMSKTKLNVASPDEVMEKYGADTMHLAIVSDSPPDQDRIYSEENVRGAHRFVRRFFEMVVNADPAVKSAKPYAGDGAGLSPAEKDLRRAVHSAIRDVTRDMSFHFNTAVSQYYVLSDAIGKAKGARPEVLKEALVSLVQLAAPIMPHVCEELWRELGFTESVFRSTWPVADARALVSETFEVPVQVNGKLRATLVLPTGASEAAIKEAALADENVRKHTEGKQVRKVIVVGGGKLVSVVIG